MPIDSGLLQKLAGFNPVEAANRVEQEKLQNQQLGQYLMQQKMQTENMQQQQQRDVALRQEIQGIDMSDPMKAIPKLSEAAFRVGDLEKGSQLSQVYGTMLMHQEQQQLRQAQEAKLRQQIGTEKYNQLTALGNSIADRAKSNPDMPFEDFKAMYAPLLKETEDAQGVSPATAQFWRNAKTPDDLKVLAMGGVPVKTMAGLDVRKQTSEYNRAVRMLALDQMRNATNQRQRAAFARVAERAAVDGFDPGQFGGYQQIPSVLTPEHLRAAGVKPEDMGVFDKASDRPVEQGMQGGGVQTGKGAMSTSTKMPWRQPNFDPSSAPKDHVDQFVNDMSEVRKLNAMQWMMDKTLPPKARRVDLVQVEKDSNALMKNMGITAEMLTEKRADIRSSIPALTELTKNTAALDAYSETAVKNFKKLLEISDRLDRSQIPILNTQYIKGIRSVAGDNTATEYLTQLQIVTPELAKINTQARLVGQLTDSARHEWANVIQPGATQENMHRIYNLVVSDIDNRKSSNENTRRALLSKFSMSGTGATSAQQKAPQAALDYLSAHPEAKDAFKAKYGYLP
jgi:hypothetical protein